jgi:hypothetical protein
MHKFYGFLYFDFKELKWIKADRLYAFFFRNYTQFSFVFNDKIAINWMRFKIKIVFFLWWCHSIVKDRVLRTRNFTSHLGILLEVLLYHAIIFLWVDEDITLEETIWCARGYDIENSRFNPLNKILLLKLEYRLESWWNFHIYCASFLIFFFIHYTKFHIFFVHPSQSHWLFNQTNVKTERIFHYSIKIPSIT